VFGKDSSQMLVVTAAMLVFFALIPIIASMTAEYTHTPLQGTILTDGFAIPNQQTKSQYYTQAAWFSIRHAEGNILDELSDISYSEFGNIDNDQKKASLLSDEVEKQFKNYTRSTINGQLGHGMIKDCNIDSYDPVYGEEYTRAKYVERNGNFVDFMPEPFALIEVVEDDEQGTYRYAYDVYELRFDIDSSNGKFAFILPMSVRLDKMIEVIHNLQESGGIIDQVNEDSSINTQDHFYVYPSDASIISLPQRSDMVYKNTRNFAEEIADREYNKINNDFQNEDHYDKLSFDVEVVGVGDDWDVDYVSSERHEKTIHVSGVDGRCWLEQRSYTYTTCTSNPLGGVSCTTHTVTYTVRLFEYTRDGYIKKYWGHIDGSYNFGLDTMTTSVYEYNGETIADSNGLETPMIEDVTRQYSPSEREDHKVDFQLQFGTTSSRDYLSDYRPSLPGCPSSYKSRLSKCTALNPGSIAPPWWYQHFFDLQQEIERWGPTYTTYSSATRTWDADPYQYVPP